MRCSGCCVHVAAEDSQVAWLHGVSFCDASARDALVRWIYARAERPIPMPMADLSGALGCEAADAPCTFSLRQLATVAYRFGDLEQAWAEREGVTLDYP